ncbi:GNAT family N-acetyltransferase [Rhizobium sp. YK2]|uniref:GNAT family N-acetyltransferase n=1 Tax=Rhizobium sp. YK2 TaxID=1860096 RepID=UPI00159F18B2|nr:GNAT family N-acetyltransferase [Rhizobium sp. YK2]
MAHDRVRFGSVNDADAICRIHRRSILELGRSSYGPEQCDSWATGLLPQNYRDAMVLKGETFLVAETNGSVVGFCSFKGDEIVGLYVDPQNGRQGVGTSLLRVAEEQILAFGNRSIILNAALSALDFYLAHGFRELERKPWKTRGGIEIEVCSMEKTGEPPMAR